MDEDDGICRSAELKLPVKFIFTAAVALAISSAAQTQQAADPSAVTLSQAVTIALEKNPMRKAAIADTKLSSADVRESRSAFLPRVTFSETAMRGNDPVYVFGSRLRQQRFTADDFSLSKLNTPSPFGNFTTRFGGTWNLFDSFASWYGVNRARQMNEAAGHLLERTEQEIVFRVINAYYGVLLADKQLDVAEQAVKTAQSILNRSQARFESGLVVESDLLTANVHMAARRQEFIRAKNNLDLAHAELNAALGIPMNTLLQPTETLSERALPVPVLQDAENLALANRPDLKRLQSEELAQRENVAMAKSSFGPRVNAFAGWEMDNPTFAAGGGNDWLGGLEVHLDIFDGGEKRAELGRQRALQEKVSAMKQVARDGIRLEVRRAYYNLDSARQEVAVARAAIAQSRDSLRINQDRYDSGLTTETDLLSAEEATRRTQTNYWEAVYRVHTSYASLALASGTLDLQSAVVMP